MKTNWVERLWVDGPWRIPFLASEIRFFQELAALPASARVLEVGCGRGAAARMIRKRLSPLHVEAIDIDPGMIRRARRWTSRSLADVISFNVADAEELPFPDGSMDAVFNFGIIHHLEDWKRGIREISRVLKPNGVFYFEEIYPALYAGFILRRVLVHPRLNRFHGPEFRAGLEDAGLKLVAGFRESKYTILGAALKDGAGP